MSKTKTSKPKERERRPENKRRIYIQPSIWMATKMICTMRNKQESVSGIIEKNLKRVIRDNAPLLRKHNLPVPAEAFE